MAKSAEQKAVELQASGVAEVEGRTMTLDLPTFERRCRISICRELRKSEPDSRLIDILSEAVRLSREYGDSMERHG